MEQNNEKWIQDAFKEAIDIDAKELSKESSELFNRDFLPMCMALGSTIGHDRAIAIMGKIVSDFDMLAAVRCFFATGYLLGTQKVKEQ